MGMNREASERVSKKVRKQFPEMKGVKPSIKTQRSPNGESTNFLLTYKGSAELPGGRTMRRVVRVVADEKGRVIRLSTSK